MSAWPSETKTALLLSLRRHKIYGHGLALPDTRLARCVSIPQCPVIRKSSRPFYASQIVAFTFPHIGNVGVNPADTETSNTTKAEAARGIIVREA